MFSSRQKKNIDRTAASVKTVPVFLGSTMLGLWLFHFTQSNYDSTPPDKLVQVDHIVFRKARLDALFLPVPVWRPKGESWDIHQSTERRRTDHGNARAPQPIEMRGPP